MDKKVFYAGVSYGKEEINAVVKSLDNQWLASGPIVAEFEKVVAKKFGKKYGIAVNSGSSANLLALASLGIKKGFKVITPALTFATTVSEIVNNGLVPVFVDSVVGRYVANEDLIEEAIDSKTAGIMVPQLVGGICDMKRLRALADKHKMFLIDDSCFVAGTKILTDRGEKNIEDIKVGDKVRTRKGYKKVLVSKLTGKRKVITKFGLIGTPNHPIITKKSIKDLDELNVSDILYTWNKEKLCIEEKTITDIQAQNFVNGECITGEAMDMVGLGLHYIDKSGQTVLVKSQKDIMSIIKTKTHLITNSRILNYLLGQLMLVCILVSQNILEKQRKTSSLLKKSQNCGMQVKKGSCGILKTEKNLGKTEKLIRKLVKFVKINTRHSIKTNQDIVQENVGVGQVIKENVYNLKVEGQPEYFANGILVHNCDTFAPTLGDRTVASYSDITTTSFYGSHIITACGVGGMFMTDDPYIRDTALTLRDWGRVGNDKEGFKNRFDFKVDELPYDSKFVYSHLGYNLKMNEVSGAFGLEQVKKLPEFLKIRSTNFEQMLRCFKEYEEWFHLPELIEGATTNWLAFPLTIKKDAPFTRYEFLEHLEANGIQTRVLFSGNITRHPIYKDVKYEIKGSLENADFVMSNGLLLGCHHAMTMDQALYMMDQARVFLDRYK